MRFKLYKLLFKQSIKEMMQYKTTFFLIIIFGILFTAIEIISTFVFFDSTNLIFGWNKDQFLLLVLTYSLIQYKYQFLFTSSHEVLSENIVEGGLDYSFIRPVNSYAFNTLFRIDFPSLINLLIVLFGVIFFMIQLQVSLLIIGLYILFVILGVWFYFVTSQIMVTLTFWFEQADFLLGLPEYVVDLGNKPRAIYPLALQILLTFVIPGLTAINSPVNIIRNDIDYMAILYYIIFLIVLTIASAFLWKKGMEKYSSAN